MVVKFLPNTFGRCSCLRSHCSCAGGSQRRPGPLRSGTSHRSAMRSTPMGRVSKHWVSSISLFFGQTASWASVCAIRKLPTATRSDRSQRIGFPGAGPGTRLFLRTDGRLWPAHAPFERVPTDARCDGHQCLYWRRSHKSRMGGCVLDSAHCGSGSRPYRNALISTSIS